MIVWIAERSLPDGSIEIAGVYANDRAALHAVAPGRTWERVETFTSTGHWWECGSSATDEDDGYRVAPHEVQT